LRPDTSLLDQLYWFVKLGGISKEGTPEHEDIVRCRTIDEVTVGHLFGVARRKQQVFATFASVWPREPDVTGKTVTIDCWAGHRQLPEIVENALLARRQVDNQWTILAEIDITHGIDDVRIRCGNERLRA